MTFIAPSWSTEFGEMARALYEERRRRARYFDGSLFGEPAWDMLLDLRIQSDAVRSPSVSSTCIGSATPASTALRHLVALEAEKLVERSPDPSDGRRKLTRLTHKGRDLMDAYLDELALRRASRDAN
ncbi:MarR family winged helix-turn-helix transcriptional regulator [Brevundimonas abyssalis]|uniref:MarR family winged helix-turn-helix transcriptional regulator n=1 Tax=Brevundimonas abyssalis TaxID=1125965 RepID=UPI0011D1F2B8|nr:MarR family winged helix-turn-helix transcriptional regulator [Brevundimonas abyssalis]